MRYFKVQIGYHADSFVSIEETELEKALYISLTGKKSMFKNGFVDGSKVMMVKEDLHRAMGWNRGYELGPEDYKYARPVIAEYEGVIEKAKIKVEEMLRSGKEFEELSDGTLKLEGK